MKEVIDFFASKWETIIEILFSGAGIAIIGWLVKKNKMKNIKNEPHNATYGKENITGNNNYIDNRVYNIYQSDQKKVIQEEQKEADRHTTKYHETFEMQNDIKNFENSTTFFQHRFAKAFPGVRGMKEFSDPKICIERLQILLKKPLTDRKLTDPIWWFRGLDNLPVESTKTEDDSVFIMNNDRLKIKRIIVYAAPTYYKEFVYVETYAEKPSGVYDINEQIKTEHIKQQGYDSEEYAEWNGHVITRAEYDDGAAEINGGVVSLNGEAEIRRRFLTPYNFIICAKFNPINKSEYDDILKKLLDGMLNGNNTIENVIDFINELPRHSADI